MMISTVRQYFAELETDIGTPNTEKGISDTHQLQKSSRINSGERRSFNSGLDQPFETLKLCEVSRTTLPDGAPLASPCCVMQLYVVHSDLRVYGMRLKQPVHLLLGRNLPR